MNVDCNASIAGNSADETSDGDDNDSSETSESDDGDVFDVPESEDEVRG